MRPGEAEIADQLMQPREAPRVLVPFGFGEFDQQERGGLAAHEGFQRRAEHRDVAGERDHGRVHQLDRNGRELDDVLRRRHRLVEAAEMHGADRAAAEQRRQLQLDRGRERQRAFRADQDVREVDVVPPRHQRIDVVAADPALHLGKARRDLVRLAAPSANRSRASGRSGEFAGRSDRSAATGPKCALLPSASSASIERTFSRVLP